MTTDMRDDELRGLLQDMAQEIPPYGPEPPGAVRRAKRRLARNGVAGLVGLGVVAAGALGAAHLLDSAPPERPAVNPTPRVQGGIVTVPVGTRPSAVAFGEGAVWVANAGDGTVSRVDPATDRVVATIEVGPGRYLEVVAGEGAVWVAKPAGTVQRIDPSTNDVVASIPAKHASGIVAGAGAVWVSDYGQGTVTKIDPRTNAVVDTIPVSGADPHGLAIEGGSLWVMIDEDGTIDRIDTATDAVVTGVRAGTGGELASGAGSVWAIGPDYMLQRIDPATNSVTTIGPVWSAPDRYQLDVAATDETVWVLTPESTVLVDPATNAVIGTISRGGYANAAGLGSSWVIGSDPNDPNSLVRLEPEAAGPPSPSEPTASPRTDVSPTTNSSSEPSGLVVAQSDSTTLHAGQSLDLQTGKTDGSGADIAWTGARVVPVGSYLASITDETGTQGDRVSDFGRLRVADLRTYRFSPLPLDGTEGPGDQLAPGDVFAVWTARGNYAKGKVIGRSASDLEIAWVTYTFGSSNPCWLSRPGASGGSGGSIVAHSDTVTLCGTFWFDFDTGTTQDGTPDVQWEQVSEVVRRMNSEGASGLVNLDDVDFDSLTLQDLQALDYQDVRIDGNDDPTNQLVPGDVFAVKTSDGNFAKAQVLAYGYNLELRFVTFNGQTGGKA